MVDTYQWMDPAMKTVTRAPDDPNNQVSMDAAGNKPPRNSLADMKRPSIAGKRDRSPEIILYGDKPGDE